MKFIAFVKSLGVKLTPAQRVLVSVAFDGVDPCELKSGVLGLIGAQTDRSLARELFGDVETIPEEARNVFVAVCGARAGKSYVLSALRMLHLALTVSLDTLAPGEVASGIIVAPDLRLAQQTLRYVGGAIRSMPQLATIVKSDKSGAIVLKRPDGRAVSIECLPATRGGSAVRGRSLVGAVLDEAAFFRDESSVVNDAEIFKAVAPRIVAGGQVVIASTPWAETGLLYELFRTNHGSPSTAIAVHAPTTLLRDDRKTRTMVERERQRDPENAAREFDAQFMAAGSGLFFDPTMLEKSIGSVTKSQIKGYAAAIDLGFRSDSSAIVLAAQLVDGRIAITESDELRPESGKPLVPSEVMESFATFLKARAGISEIVADAHYIESAREHAGKHGLSIADAPSGQDGKVEVHLAVRELLNAGRLILPNDPRLLAQLKSIVSKPTAGGGLSISTPRRRGFGHGDLASAAILAAWRARDCVSAGGFWELTDEELGSAASRYSSGRGAWL